MVPEGTELAEGDGETSFPCFEGCVSRSDKPKTPPRSSQ